MHGGRRLLDGPAVLRTKYCRVCPARDAAKHSSRVPAGLDTRYASAQVLPWQLKAPSRVHAVLTLARLPLSSLHVSSQAGIRRAGGADRGAVASGTRVAGSTASLPERAPGHRSRGRARRGGGVRRGQGAPRCGVRRSGRGSQLAEAEGVGPFRAGLGRSTWPVHGRLPLRCRWRARRGKPSASPACRGRISAPPFGLISGPDLRIFFGYRVACFSGTLMSAWPEESTTNERM
jgi:hypothetical protein